MILLFYTNLVVSPGLIAAIAVMVVIVVGSGIGFLVWYRKRKFETELMAASWKITYSDILFTKDAKVCSTNFLFFFNIMWD